MSTIICSSCSVEKPTSSFDKRKDTKLGFSRQCKACRKTVKQRYNVSHRSSSAAQMRRWRQSHPSQVKEKRQARQQQQAEYVKVWRRQKYHGDPEWRAMQLTRNRVNKVLRRLKFQKPEKTSELLGCHSSILTLWLRFQFGSTMSWSNMGTHWHVDHVIPLRLFDMTDDKQRHIACHWTNVRPLSKEENQRKGGKLTLPCYFNSIVAVHRFIQHYDLDNAGYQAICESKSWLRKHLRYGDNPQNI